MKQPCAAARQAVSICAHVAPKLGPFREIATWVEGSRLATKQEISILFTPVHHEVRKYPELYATGYSRFVTGVVEFAEIKNLHWNFPRSP
jgi:hypothetical protein